VTHKWSWHRFRYGVVGAAAPEIVHFYKAYKASELVLPAHFPAGVLLFFAFICFGGIFASAWEEDSPIKCIYNGATFPLVLIAWFNVVAK
jgi:hypothetical protein